MSGSIDALNGQGISFQFDKFAQMAASAAKGSNVVRFLGDASTATVREVIVTTSDRVGKLGRSDSVKTANDTTRAIFRQSVAAMFGGEDRIPENVKTAMKLNDYGKGKPLTARRIIAVKVAVDEAMGNFPVEPPKINAPKAEVRQSGLPGGEQGSSGLLSAHDVTNMGYAPAELKTLNDIAEMYKQATSCTTVDAQKAALDPKSDARRLFSYGGVFTASPEGFAKGLQLLNDFKKWFADYVQSDENQKCAIKSVRMGDSLSIEKFVFEEIACNQKLSINSPDPSDIFGAKNNLAMQCIKDNTMEAISGSLAGIPAEKRSVFYALASALRENDGPKGRPFSWNSTLLSRTLTNFNKAADLVYSGTLSRTTALNTLFPDFRKIGLNAHSTNDDIQSAVSTYNQLNGAMDDALENNDTALYNTLKMQSYNAMDMFNTTGASITDCLRAAKEGRRIGMAEGMTTITGDIADASGFTDAGRDAFIGDVHRLSTPMDPKTNEPLIKQENVVFRFNIGGQKFTAKACSYSEKNNPVNVGIAKEVENFCNKKVHPIQTNAVFFALSQGGLAPQMGLASYGYATSEHGPITYSLSKNAETGDVTIKYSNPEGSPLKFSWTATIDVNGKTTSTPIQIEK